MLILNLIRHAESESFSFNNNDFDRKLTGNGIDQALNLGTYFLDEKINLGNVFCSDALRTRQTIELIFSKLITIPSFEFVHELYETTHENLLHFLATRPESVRTITLVGHNSGISSLASYLCGDYIHMETANFVCIHFPLSGWAQLVSDCGTLHTHFHP